jgi:hypothetical protein
MSADHSTDRDALADRLAKRIAPLLRSLLRLSLPSQEERQRRAADRKEVRGCRP